MSSQTTEKWEKEFDEYFENLRWDSRKGTMNIKDFISQAIQAAISVREKEISDEVIGAVARGWTHEVNAKKIMDSDLALAIEKEMYLVIHPIDHQ